MSRKQRNVEHAMTPYPNTIEIPKFNGQNLDITSWLKFFNKKCQQNHFDEDYKLKNISNYLDGEAFNFFIEQLQDIDNWGELEQKVLSYFTVKDSNLFSKFLNLKYNDKDDLDIYFKEKSSLAKKLNLDTPLLLEALTDGMPNYLKKYLIAARVKETSDWIKIATQLKYSTNQEKQEPQCKYNSDNQQPSTSNDNRQNFQTRSYYPARSRLNPNSPPSLQSQPPPRSSPRSTTAHHQEASSRTINLPPYPCKICASHQLPNQYHFHRDCPLKNNNHPKRINPGYIKTNPICISLLDNIPIAQKPYRTSFYNNAEIQKQITELLKYDIIRPSSSPYSSPALLVNKKSDAPNHPTRLCIDYRKLNQKTVPEHTPIPLIEQIIDRLSQSKIYTILDVKNAYWHIPIDEKDRHKTSFVTQLGCYEWNRLPYGLKNAPSQFERIMKSVFTKHNIHYALYYFDDIIIHSKTYEEHIKHLDDILGIFEQEDIKLNLNKCKFLQKEIQFLGYTINSGKYTPNNTNIEAILKLNRPYNIKTLQRFLGTINIYNKFIPHYAQIRAPLNELLLKNAPWLWSVKHEQAFQTLKNSLISQPVLYIYDPSKPCHLFTDASSLGVAGVLKQPDEQGILHPIGYFSRKLHPYEQNYTASEIETLAIINSVQRFHTYLHNIHFTLHTDHLPLKWIKNVKNPQGRLFRWSLILSQYSFDIKHIKGLNNIEADMLSRAPVSFYLTYSELKEHQTTEQISSAKFKIQNGLYIINRRGFKRAYMPISTHPNHIFSLDTLGGLHNYGTTRHSIHMIVDHHSRFLWAFPTKSVSTDSYITCLRNLFQINKPEILITDRNAAFLSRKFKNFLERNNDKHLLTSSHHPETNAKVERLNSTIINRLRCEYNANLKIPWTKYIPKITESYNETVHTTTGFTPKFLYYGIQPQYIEHDTETHTPIEKARKLAIERTIKSHEHSKQLYDIKHPEPIFKEGDQVLVKTFIYPNTGLEPQENIAMIKQETQTKMGEYHFQPFRNPSIFTGERNQNPEKWLKEFHRVARYNCWDDSMCLANVYFFLQGTAHRWYENVEEKINSWDIFVKMFSQNFGHHVTQKDQLAENLKTRAQGKEETSDSYIQDVLHLCREVNPAMMENEIVAHLTKGISEEIYQSIIILDIASIDELPNVAAIDSADSESMEDLIRRIVREEVHRALNPESTTPEPSSLKEIIREEIEKNGEAAGVKNPPSSTAAKLQQNYVEIIIDDIAFSALVDSGSSFSVISDGLRRQLKKTMFKDSGMTLKVADGKNVTSIGRCTISLSINGLEQPLEFIVLPNSNPSIILGWDFLEASNAVIDCGRAEIRLEEAKDVLNSPSSMGKVVASRSVVIPAESTKLINVMSEELNGQNQVLFEPSKKVLIGKGLTLPCALFRLSHNKGKLWIVNSSTTAQIVPKGMCLGKIQRVEENNLTAISECSESNKEVKNANHASHADKSDFKFLQNLISDDLSEEQQSQIFSILKRYDKIFDKNNESVKQTSLAKHKIETGNHQPIKHRPYRVSPTERQAIQTEVDKMLDAGIIRHSESPWSSPVILVKKKDGNWRFCVDYRRLNKVTKKDVYPLPRIDDTLDSLKGAKFYSSMDLRSGYWQIEVDEADREKTAFITPDGLYEFLVMPFGLCNAPATFERMMDKILKGLKWTMALCYLDDIVVYSKSFSEHLHRLEIILQCLDKAELRLNPKKCLFGAKRIRVFGHLVDSKGIYPDPEKIEAIAKFPTPKSITDVRSFIGLCSYYRRFIENFAEKAAPLHEVLKKDNKFMWNSDQQDAFDSLKKALMSEPVLAYFEEQLPTELHTDASGYGIGAILVQINDGKERPVGYASRTLSKAEKNYFNNGKRMLGRNMGHQQISTVPFWSLTHRGSKRSSQVLNGRCYSQARSPREIITDRGRVFQSKLIAELTNQCSSIHRFTTAYHPQTNGLTERLNKTLANMIAMYVSVEQKDWDVILPYVTFAYNTAKQDTTGFTPFKLIHGREAETTVDTLFPNPHEDLQEDYSQKIALRVEETRQLARLETLKAQEKDKARYDSKHEAMDYNVGDLVWIFIPIRKVGLSEKLMKRYFGPYRVTRKLSDVTFEVEPVDQLTRRSKTRDLVHVLRMKPYHDPEDQADLFK
ncbi:hypothetical protein LAZ67_X001970 [Cordylochernes scorpioides]|uniref:RNA-directed DNA polymerase n=1 Tax=Cordylochernes scorpioides TaxID=51811 RepID=A0ABY6LW66_9ARAC|nr:hypothetical protein LAZ67_X001970 [Cordylochernes scorpioides]